ncbi:MAG TPA: heme-binding protein [Bryobacteraceae bacterium]|nr:heme-binding protein [Bryobacteraceae bacterium]
MSTDAAYDGNAANYGQANDPMVGRKIGGINVFGGGLALYNKTGVLVGALGVSGDTSCTDHIVAWKTRHALNFDDVPAGVGAMNTDNMIMI